jgi:hypothetical protein
MRGGIGKIIKVSPSWIYCTKSLHKYIKKLRFLCEFKFLQSMWFWRGTYLRLIYTYLAYSSGRSLVVIAGSNPAGRRKYLSREIIVCCQVEVSAAGRSLFQRSPNECGVSECNIETLTVWRPVELWEKNYIILSPQIKNISSINFKISYLQVSFKFIIIVLPKTSIY